MLVLEVLLEFNYNPHMTTLGHITSSYILANASRLVGLSPTDSEILITILAGNILDLDVFAGVLLKKRGDEHHNLITHSPFGALLIYIPIAVLLAYFESYLLLILIPLAFLLHLVLDDISYWFCRLGIQQISKYPQINWLYPVKQGRTDNWVTNNRAAIITYFKNARVNVVLEGIFLVVAVLLFFFS